MALEQLLASLTRDAEIAVADLLRVAHEEADATRAAVTAERRRRQDAAVAEARGALEALLAQDVGVASREASRAVLRVREELLARVLAQARACLATRHHDTVPASIALLREAASYLGDTPATMKCAAVMRVRLDPVARELKLLPTTGDTMGPGTILTTTDARLTVDATLDQLLLRVWPEEAIRIGARLEALS